MRELIEAIERKLNKRSKVKDGERLTVIKAIPSAWDLFGPGNGGQARVGDMVTVRKVTSPGDPLSQARGSGAMVEFRAQISRGDRLDVKITPSNLRYFARRS